MRIAVKRPSTQELAFKRQGKRDNRLSRQGHPTSPTGGPKKKKGKVRKGSMGEGKFLSKTERNGEGSKKLRGERKGEKKSGDSPKIARRDTGNASRSFSGPEKEKKDIETEIPESLLDPSNYAEQKGKKNFGRNGAQTKEGTIQEEPGPRVNYERR